MTVYIRIILLIELVQFSQPRYQLCDNSLRDTVIKEKCYDGLGCVSLTPQWTHPRYRPVNMMPADRHVINTIFVRWRLDDKNNLTSDILGTAMKDNMQNTEFKILIHDFTSNGYVEWIQHLACLILKNAPSPQTLISVDWAAGAEPPYAQAVANARLVALEIINFLNKLQVRYSIEPCQVHIIAHGLGAHIAGYVGKLIVGLEKITALDPTGPYFDHMPPQVRLHRNDACYTEVIHTDGGKYGQGTKQFLGHIDIFANGGLQQPGCAGMTQSLPTVERADLKLGETLAGCSHKRSVKYYLEAIVNPMCSFIGIACKSFKDFMKGKCASCGPNNDQCIRLHPLQQRTVNATNGFYFITSNSFPFCGEMLKVTIMLQSNDTNAPAVKGFYKITVPQILGDASFFINENYIFSRLQPNKRYTFLVFRSTPPPLLLPAMGLKIKWYHGFLPCSWCTPPKVHSLELTKLSDTVPEETQLFCPSSAPAAVTSPPHYAGVNFSPCNKNITNRPLHGN